MKAKNSRVTIHMVASLDGFIAKKDGSVSWMDSTDNYEQGITLTEGYIADFLEAIDCYVMGARTYEHAINLGWPYGETPVFVLTNRPHESDNNSVNFLSGNLRAIVNEKLKPKYKNIWMVGGSMLTKKFLSLGLADEINITIVPILLGGGTLFFDYIGSEQSLHLKEVTAFKNGMVELWYEIVKESKEVI
ncbi:MAG: dihydrofolate reductase family protein [Bacteroidota bacterium]